MSGTLLLPFVHCKTLLPYFFKDHVYFHMISDYIFSDFYFKLIMLDFTMEMLSKA